jgi:hypothetical protein
MHPDQIHAQLDAYEEKLKGETKRIQAVRTLLPPPSTGKPPRGNGR